MFSLWSVLFGQPPLKLLHLGFHKGCIDDFTYVAQQLGIDLTSWFIIGSKESARRFYGKDFDLNIYNIRHEDADRIWHIHKDYFESFDAIMTSDTVPLARIFLQNGWSKPLIIWVCNRFDLRAGYDKQWVFPDTGYYNLMRTACSMPNVHIASYTPYEQEYAATKSVILPSLVIKPVGLTPTRIDPSKGSCIPATIHKSTTLFLAPRFFKQQHADFVIRNCLNHDIPVYYGKYNGPDDLIGFKGIIHFPYQASVLSLFENIHRGLTYFIPSETFVAQILKEQGDIIPHFWQSGLLGQEHAPEFWHSEFYRPEHKELFVYFDSWQDLKNKIETTNYAVRQTEIKAFGVRHAQAMLARWNELFKKVYPTPEMFDCVSFDDIQDSM
jgi:hypothetical protein